MANARKTLDLASKLIGKNPKTVSLLITLFVIGLLLVVGPVNALNLTLNDFSSTPVERGSPTSVIAEIEIRSDEVLDINEISFILDGVSGEALGKNYSCDFDVSGSKISACNGFTIESLSNTALFGYGYGYGYGYNYGYGYGYGYSNGVLRYKITLDSLNFETGKYSSHLFIDLIGKSYNSNTKELEILPIDSEDGNDHTASGGSYREYRNSTVNNETVIPEDYIPSNNGEEEQNNTETRNQTSTNTNFLTGAVVGALTKQSSVFIIVFILIIVIALIIVRIRILHRRELSMPSLQMS